MNRVRVSAREGGMFRLRPWKEGSSVWGWWAKYKFVAVDVAGVDKVGKHFERPLSRARCTLGSTPVLGIGTGARQVDDG